MESPPGRFESMPRDEYWRRHLREVLNASTQVAIIGAELDGTIVIFNSGAERMLGYSAGEMIGKQTPLVFHLPEEVQAHGDLLSREFGRAIQGFDVFVEYARRGLYEERDWVYVRKDGSHLHVHLVVTGVRDDAGRMFGYLGVAADIEKQMLYEKELADSLEGVQRRFSAFMDNLPAVAFVKDSQGRYLYVNPYAMKTIGVAESAWLHRTNQDVWPATVAEALTAQDRHVLDSMQPLTSVETFQTTSGQRCFEAVKFPIPGAEVLLGGIAFDVTARKQAQAALQDREAMLAMLVESIPAGVSYIDAGGRYRFSNSLHARTINKTLGSYLGEKVDDVIDPRVYPEWREQLDKVLSGQPVQFEHSLESSGELRHFRVSGTPRVGENGQVLGCLTLLTDVTAQHELERALRDREAQLRLVTDNVPAFISYVDADGRYRYCNRSHEAWIGKEAASCLGQRMSDVLEPEFYERVKPYADAALAGKTVTFDNTRTRDDGTTGHLQVTFAPHFGSQGEILGFIALAADVSERRALEESLRQSEAMTRALIETAAVGILMSDASGRITAANQTVAAFFGYGRDELIGASIESLVPESQRHLHREHREHYFASPRTRAMGADIGIRGRRKDGTEFPLEVGLSHTQSPEGPTAVAFVHDVTQRKLQETRLRALTEQLLKAQEEERRLIARELHDDVTQKIALISMELGMILKDAGTDSTGLESSLRMIQDRALSLAEDVRLLSHELHPSALEHSGLAAALEGHCAEFSHGTGIEAHFTQRGVMPKLGRVQAASLYRIAQEAMRNASKHSGATRVDVVLTADATGTRLSVIDDGRGFDAAKAREEAHLGLVSMGERARLASGMLEIHSEPGAGTRVEVRIPPVDKGV